MQGKFKNMEKEKNKYDNYDIHIANKIRKFDKIIEKIEKIQKFDDYDFKQEYFKNLEKSPKVTFLSI